MLIGYRVWAVDKKKLELRSWANLPWFHKHLWVKGENTDVHCERCMSWARVAKELEDEGGYVGWWERIVEDLEERCRECRKGLYALKSIEGLKRDMRWDFSDGALVAGAVLLSGNVVEGERGYRAEHMEPVELVDAKGLGSGDVGKLAVKYGVELGKRENVFKPQGFGWLWSFLAVSYVLVCVPIMIVIPFAIFRRLLPVYWAVYHPSEAVLGELWLVAIGVWLWFVYRRLKHQSNTERDLGRVWLRVGVVRSRWVELFEDIREWFQSRQFSIP